MFCAEGKRISFKVTPTHRMIVYERSSRKVTHPDHDAKPTVKPAQDLKQTDTLKIHARWSGLTRESIRFPETVSSTGHTISESKMADAHDWASFLGWFVSEGHTFSGVSKTQGNARHRVHITQNPGTKQESIRQLLDRLPWKFHSVGNRQFTCASKQLYEAVQCCGTGVKNKRVPQWIKDSQPSIIEAFVASAISGDGWADNTGRIYATVSKRLADDMQELFIKLGGQPSLRICPAKPYRIRGRAGSNTSDQYHVRDNVCRHSLALDGKDHEFMVKKVHYQGRVYCATVPNGTLIVRRAGKTLICGNCEVYALHAARARKVHLMRPAQWEHIEQQLSQMPLFDAATALSPSSPTIPAQSSDPSNPSRPEAGRSAILQRSRVTR